MRVLGETANVEGGAIPRRANDDTEHNVDSTESADIACKLQPALRAAVALTRTSIEVTARTLLKNHSNALQQGR
jgi:hypothetical protein